MEMKTVTHDRPGEPLSVTVGEADVLTGMRHVMLISEARALIRPDLDGAEEGQPDLDGAEEGQDQPLTMPEGVELALYLLRRYTWPNCKAAAKGSQGFDHEALEFEEFVRLPERFVAKWEKAVLELNPHWELLAGKEDDEEAKKGDGASASE